VVSGRFSHGAASLTDRLAQRLGDAISLETTVHHIEHIEYRPEHGNGSITVTHSKGSVTAQHVVLAIPPSIAASCIEFEPALPPDLAALAAATPVWMGNIVKVVVIYKQAFWQHAGLSGAAMSHIGPLREIHDMSGAHFETAALFGFVPLGPDAPVPQKMDIINQLVEIFGPEAASPLKVVIKDWRTDNQHTTDQRIQGQRISSQGTTTETYGHPLYQVPVSNLKNNLETNNLEISCSIHWASTETAPVSPGHIEGALAAAERAIKAIIS
jgi:monoamine oxidase